MSEGFVGSEVIRINLLSQQPLDESIQKLVNDNPRNVVPLVEIVKPPTEQPVKDDDDYLASLLKPKKKRKRKKKRTEEEEINFEIEKIEAKNAKNLKKGTIVKIDGLVYRVTSNIYAEEFNEERANTVKEDSAKGSPVGKFFYTPHRSASRGLLSEEESRLYPVIQGELNEWFTNRENRHLKLGNNYFMFKSGPKRNEHFRQVDSIATSMEEYHTGKLS
tara:strand:- start:35 stop:691 length:657 start_codon:yes stop_codon:yes gene_type:complete